MSDISHPDEEQSSIDALLTAEAGTFWRAIHRMSSAAHKPSRWSGVWGSPWSANAHRGTMQHEDGRALRGVRRS